MCGFSGAFHFGDNSSPVDQAILAKMNDHMRLRGPDDEGFWFSGDGRIGFSHRRLAIIDLSEAGHQPLESADGRFVIVFNGEIYNYRPLRDHLEKNGVQFKTHTDTEVILEVYRRDGPDGFARLRGMYAFAIWDLVEHRLLLARDPFGIKPLYVYRKGGDFRFASQVKALIAGGKLDTTPEEAGHAGFFLWGHVPEPFTLYRHIQAFPAGHYQVITAKGPEPPRAFSQVSDILRAGQTAPENGPPRGTKGLLEALTESLAYHHVSDVPVGVFLSAGKDSSTLAALSAESVPTTQLRTFTLGFKEYIGTGEDEVPLAEETAALLNTQHVTRWVSAKDFEDEMDHILAAMDQPSIDGINTYFVSKYAADSGLKVALSGLGGDELFGGYPSFQQVPFIHRLFGGVPLGPLGRMFRRLSQGWLGSLTSPKYAGIFEYGGTIAGAYLLRRALHMPWEIESLLGRDMARIGLDRLQPVAALQRTIEGIKDPYLAVMALEMTAYMRDRLLRDSDWASMAHSLELRTPLVDWPLFMALGPWLLRKDRPRKDDLPGVIKHRLPKAVLSRSKTGFSVPVRDYFLEGRKKGVPRGLRGWARLVYNKFVE